MRILKYIFLLLLLAFIGITVYVATQKGDFEVTKSSVVKAQRSTVFDYVNDYRNWETFGSWMTKGTALKFEYGSKTMGAGGASSWKNDSDHGSLRTYFVNIDLQALHQLPWPQRQRSRRRRSRLV